MPDKSQHEQAFDFAPLLRAGLPGRGGQIDRRRRNTTSPAATTTPTRLPLDGLIAAANSVLQREGRTLATYGLDSGPAGLPAAARIPGRASSSATPASSAPPTTSSSPRARCRRSIWSTACCSTRGDTVIIEQDCYQGTINRLTPGSASTRSASRSTATACGWTRCRTRSTTSSAGACGRNTSTPSRPCRTRPAPSCRRRAAREMLRLADAHGVPIFEDDCYADLIWDGERPPALYAMSKSGNVIHIGSFSKSIAPALARRLHRRAVGDAVAHAVAQDRCRLRRARADGARGILRAAFRRARAGADARACARSSTR